MSLLNSQENSPAETRVAARLSTRTEKTVYAYALAAGAAGVGLLAVAQPVQAEIVFTPVDIVFSRGTIYIDLNHDGINDFHFADEIFLAPHSQFPLIAVDKLAVGGDAGAAVIASRHQAAVLTLGEVVASSRSFRGVNPKKLLMARGNEVYRGSTGTCCNYFYGNWKGASKGYLGLKFLINGETHFGWARLSVQTCCDSIAFRITAHLTGFAYETIPNQPIQAGQTAATPVGTVMPSSAIPMPGSLGALALGSAGR